jgi:hypothetical protein
MWPYTEAEQHWLDGRSGIAWPPDRQQITPQLTERLIAEAHNARAEALAEMSRQLVRKIAASADAVPEIIERHGMRHTYLLAERIADALVRLVAMFGRWPTPRRPSQSERDTAGLA